MNQSDEQYTGDERHRPHPGSSPTPSQGPQESAARSGPPHTAFDAAAPDHNRTERLPLPGNHATAPQPTTPYPDQPRPDAAHPVPGGSGQARPYGQQPGGGPGQHAAGPQHQQQVGGPQGPFDAPGRGEQWYGSGGNAGGAGMPPQTPGNSAWNAPSGGTPQRRGGSRLAVPVAALLAAVLASGGTYALTQGQNSGGNGSPQATTKVVEGNPTDFVDAGTTNWSATAQKVIPSVVAITASRGNSGGRGSGVILDDKGNIVTNNHVVNGTQNIMVTLSDNRSYKAEIVGTDPSTDLAVIKLSDPPSNLKPIELGDDSNLVVGQPTMAVGNPLGLAGTVTTGIVSALNRPVSTQQSRGDEGQGGSGGGSGSSQTDATEVVTNAIQTSAAINPGNSGGALVNGSGKLIGINSSIASLSGSSGSSQSGNIGIGFAIPVTVVKNITQQLISNGKAQHALLGVSAQTGTVELDGATLTGAKVASVEPNSGAAKAGLRDGDVILTIDGDAVESSTSLVGQVRERTVGQRVALTVVRDGKRVNVTVTLGAAPTS